MAKQSRTRSNAPADTRRRIVAAATLLFSKQGYDGTSTKEICEAAKVNIAAIHYHFTSKAKLFSEIIETYGSASLRSMQKILEPPETSQELELRLRLFLDDAIESMLSQPDLSRIVQAEIELMHARSEPVFRRTFLKRFETLVQFLEHAKKRGMLHKELDPRLAARSLFSQVCHQTRTDAVFQKYYGSSLKQADYRALWIKQTLQIFIKGIHGK